MSQPIQPKLRTLLVISLAVSLSTLTAVVSNAAASLARHSQADGLPLSRNVPELTKPTLIQSSLTERIFAADAPSVEIFDVALALAINRLPDGDLAAVVVRANTIAGSNIALEFVQERITAVLGAGAGIAELRASFAGASTIGEAGVVVIEDVAVLLAIARLPGGSTAAQIATRASSVLGRTSNNSIAASTVIASSEDPLPGMGNLVSLPQEVPSTALIALRLTISPPPSTNNSVFVDTQEFRRVHTFSNTAYYVSPEIRSDKPFNAFDEALIPTSTPAGARVEAIVLNADGTESVTGVTY